MATINERSTKATILGAYEALQEELRALKSENRKLKSGGGGGGGRKAAAPVDGIDGVLRGLEGLRSNFGDSANTLQSKLTAEAERLAELRGAVEARVAQLKQLHEIEPSADTLSTLLSTYEQTAESFDDEMQSKRENFEAKQAAQRVEWSKERELHRLSVQERDEALKTARTRDEAEYSYTLQQQRDLDQDTYAQEQLALEAELTAMTQEHQARWDEQEKDLSEREDHYIELKAKVEGFEQTLASAIRSSREEGLAISRRKAKNDADLLAKEREGQLRVNELQIESLTETLNKQQAEISELSAKLTDAQRRAQELAVKAIEGASNETSFVAIKEIAMEQAKTQSKR